VGGVSGPGLLVELNSLGTAGVDAETGTEIGGATVYASVAETNVVVAA
jgi:hypothetical protein